MTRHKLIINVGPRITFHYFAACDRRATARYPTATRCFAKPLRPIMRIESQPSQRLNDGRILDPQIQPLLCHRPRRCAVSRRFSRVHFMRIVQSAAEGIDLLAA